MSSVASFDICLHSETLPFAHLKGWKSSVFSSSTRIKLCKSSIRGKLQTLKAFELNSLLKGFLNDIRLFSTAMKHFDVINGLNWNLRRFFGFHCNDDSFRCKWLTIIKALNTQWMSLWLLNLFRHQTATFLLLRTSTLLAVVIYHVDRNSSRGKGPFKIPFHVFRISAFAILQQIKSSGKQRGNKINEFVAAAVFFSCSFLPSFKYIWGFFRKKDSFEAQRIIESFSYSRLLTFLRLYQKENNYDCPLDKPASR